MKRSSDQVVKEVEDKRTKTVKVMQVAGEKTEAGVAAELDPKPTEPKTIVTGEIPNVSIELSFIFQHFNKHYSEYLAYTISLLRILFIW